MAKYLITGVSSGIGKSLTKELIRQGNTVWGIARRENFLLNLKEELQSDHFVYSVADQGKESDWRLISRLFQKKKFIPQIIIFNAAISENDLNNQIKLKSLEKMFRVNFFGIMKGINTLLPIIKPKAQIIAISTFSALKGSGTEGIGYPSSKSALSIAFESLYQRYKKRDITFKTIFFGPVNSGMSPFKRNAPFILSETSAVRSIINAVKGNDVQYYYPKTIFFIFRLIKLLPSSIYFKILSGMESIHLKHQKKC